MSGPEHWQRAEQLLAMASEEPADPDAPYAHERYLLAKAQLHATLALVAATVQADGHRTGDTAMAWRYVGALS